MSLDFITLHLIVFPCSITLAKNRKRREEEEIEEQQSTETENLNKGRLTVRFVLLRLQLKSQYSLVYKRGDSVKQGTKIF